MSRICPSCKSLLGYYDVYFCSSCGNPLPNELVKTDRKFTRAIKINREEKASVVSSIDWKKLKPLMSFFVITVFIGTLAFLGIKLMNSSTIFKAFLSTAPMVAVNTPAAAIPSSTANTISVETDFNDGDFDHDDLRVYVPGNVDLYVEGNDLDKFANSLVAADLALDSKFLTFYEKNKTQFKPSFIMFVKKLDNGYAYGFVVETSSPQPVVITNDLTISSSISDVSKGIEKSIKYNPIYAAAKSATPKAGQFFIVVTSKNGRAFLYNLIEQKIPVDLLRILNKFLDSKLDYAVVLKE